MRGRRLLAELTQVARQQQATLVMSEANDDRVLKAAEVVSRDGIAKIILISDAPLAELAPDIEVVSPQSDARLNQLAQLYVTQRPRTNLKVAHRIVSKPLFFAGMMVRAGMADGLVAGASTTTAKVIEASLLTVGPAPGISTPSSAFLMLLSNANLNGRRELLFADCAINVLPDAQQLADIALASAQTYQNLTGNRPRVAMLSFSTHSSANHDLAVKVAKATALVRGAAPSLAVDGELQADTALISNVATTKLDKAGEVAGRANVLVFPSLEAGNIGYKLTQYLGDAQAIGPILQGFNGAVSDLSRGASVEDIVSACILTAAQKRRETLV